MKPLLSLATVLLLTSPALAHVTLGIPEGEAGKAYRAVLSIGHGCDGAATTSVSVQIPEGLYNVKPLAKPGWQIETVIGPYETPFDNHGTMLTEGVVEITWSGGNLPDDHFDEFTFRGTFGADLAEGTVYFPVVQQCGDAESAWIDTSGAEGAEHPAPGMMLHPHSGMHHH
jgi:uncharacterized protein YcnI